jgi:hypothetical protein
MIIWNNSYANINENLDELKSANGKLYWKTMNMLIKNENSSNETPPLSDSQNYFKHILAIFKNIDVKSETAPWISQTPVI